MTPYTSQAASKKKKGRGPLIGEDDLLVEPGNEMAVVDESEGEDEDEPAVVAKKVRCVDMPCPNSYTVEFNI